MQEMPTYNAGIPVPSLETQDFREVYLLLQLKLMTRYLLANRVFKPREILWPIYCPLLEKQVERSWEQILNGGEKLQEGARTIFDELSNKFEKYPDNFVRGSANVQAQNHYIALFRLLVDRLDILSQTMRELFRDIYGEMGTHQLISRNVAGSTERGWARLFANKSALPTVILSDPQRIDALGHDLKGVYKYYRYTVRPEGENNSNTVCCAVLKIDWPREKSDFPTYEIHYKASRRIHEEEIYLSSGIAIPTADQVYLMGSERDLQNLAFFAFDYYRKPYSAIHGLMCRKHSQDSLFTTKFYAEKQPEGTSLDSLRGWIGFQCEAEIENFDKIRKYIVNNFSIYESNKKTNMEARQPLVL